MEEPVYTCIKTLIGVGSTDDAQHMLDDIEEKDAEWHYLSSLLYREKNWYNESRKQLEIAIELDPGNDKYKEELEELKSVAENEESDGQPEMGKGKFRAFCGNVCACCQPCCEGCSGACGDVCAGC